MKEFNKKSEEGLTAISENNKLRLQNGILFGVCGSLGAFFDINPWWVRLAFIILLLPGGLPGLLLYLVLWMVIPRKK